MRSSLSPAESSNPATRASAAAWTVVALAALALVGLVAVSPHRPIYDEVWYLDTLRLLQRDGLSLKFLREFPGAAGPTFTLVFAAADSLFGLDLPWLRLVNVALLAAASILIWHCLVAAPPPRPPAPGMASPALTAATLTLLPTAGVAAGMALTEMPAAFFSVAAIALLTRAFVARGAGALISSALGGIALAAAVLGRQNYLLLLPCLALTVRWNDGRPNRPDLLRVAILAVVAMLLVTPVFVLWGGLVPPLTAWSTAGLAPGHVVRGTGYAGFILLLLAPEVYAPLWRRRSWLAGTAIFSLPLAVMLGDRFVPLRATIAALTGGNGLTFIAGATAYALSFAALAFVLCFTLHLWRHRDHWLTRFAGAAVLLGLLSNAKITHLFSSRYVFIVLPLLVIAAAPAMRMTRWTWLQMTSAAGISLAALASYYVAS